MSSAKGESSKGENPLRKQAATEEDESLPPLIRVLLTLTAVQLLFLTSGALVYYLVHSKHTILHRFVVDFKSNEKVAYASVAFGFLLIVISHIPALIGRALKNSRGVNNSVPRKDVQDLKGWAYRAWISHQNTIEAFPSFAAAVLIALHAKVAGLLIAKLCVIWVISRIAYILVYIFNLATIRTFVWFVGWTSILSLFLLPFQPSLFAASPASIFENVKELIMRPF
jgi:uncharacterized MAPEG superfamily protein